MFRIRLKELREKHDLSQYDLAEKLGIKQSTIAMWENGTNHPRHTTLLKISELFDVPVDFLAGNSKTMLQKSGPNKIPVLGTIQAGIPIEAVEEILDYEEITPEMAAEGDHFALKIKGTSMEPKFSAGDVVIVRAQPDVDSGDIAIVLVNGDEATIKKIKKGPDGIMLIPSNPEYEVMFYSNEEIETKPVVILGKVVELRAKF